VINHEQPHIDLRPLSPNRTDVGNRVNRIRHVPLAAAASKVVPAAVANSLYYARPLSLGHFNAITEVELGHGPSARSHFASKHSWRLFFFFFFSSGF